MIYDLITSQFPKMLSNLNKIIDKGSHFAREKKLDEAKFWQSQLAVDQFNFVRQIQIACDTAKFCASSLAGKEAPNHPDTEQTAQIQKKNRTEKFYAVLFRQRVRFS